MEYPKFRLSKRQADLAGQTLVSDASPEEKIDAFEVVENWRFNHVYPIHAYTEAVQKLVDEFAGASAMRPVVGSRLKRLPSIYGKLKRFRDMKLSRMQDIGGLRVIFPAFEDVYAFERRLAEANLPLLKRRCDYIERPKVSGYRSLHLIYEFRDPTAPEEYQGIAIEFQLRDAIQHYWATTLETFSVFMGHSLKEGGGPEETLRFFETASACFAHLEGSPCGEAYAGKSPKDLARELAELDRSLNVFGKLESYRNTLEITHRESRSGAYVLLKLNSRKGEVDVRFFERAELSAAYQAYSDTERGAQGEDVVLVAVHSLEELLSAYPNYFANTTEFVALAKGFLRDHGVCV